MGEHAPCRIREVIDPEELINTVKCHRVLYDTTHQDYGSNKKKNKVWDVVAKELGARDKDNVRAKWKNLRDSYTKYLRSLDPQQVAQCPKYTERYRTWPWVKNMQFLLPYLDIAAKINVDMPIQPECPQYPASSSAERITVKRKKVEIQELLKFGPTEQTYKRKSRRNTEEYNDARTDKLCDYSEFDDTDLIFLGYARTIKKMSIRRQASVKFGIAQLIMDAEIEQDDENNLQKLDANEQNYYTDKGAIIYSGLVEANQENQDPLSSQDDETDDEKPIKNK